MLPIGSVVYLNQGSKKIMILNRGPLLDVDGEKKIFDYSGCVYPVGLVPDQVLYFNQENVDKVLFEGYSDEDEVRFQEMFEQWRKDNAQLSQGVVEKPLDQ